MQYVPLILLAKRSRSVGPVAQWITRLTTDQKIPGSNPGRVVHFFKFISLSSRDSEVCISKSTYLTLRIPPNYELLLKRSLPNVIEEIHN